MTRMFTYEGKAMKTWNVWIGCRFACTYCSVRKLATTRLRHLSRYEAGFHPMLIVSELDRKFRPGEFIFAGYMGDISFAPPPSVRIILEKVRAYPETRFLLCTKNPAVYKEWGFEYPSNLYLGATIESNIDHGVSKAPPPAERYEAMKALQHAHKFISLEPLMDFHLATLIRWMEYIRPEIIEIGPDNYHNALPEPRGGAGHAKAPWKVRWLLEELKKACPTVVEKPGLQRLLGIS